MVDKLFTATKAFIENPSGKILLLKESKKYDEGANSGKWDVAGGRVKKGERFTEGLRREIEEETGLKAEVNEPFHTDEWRPEVDGEKWQIVGTYFICKTERKDVELSEDHEDYAWTNPEDFSEYNLIEGLEKALKKFLQKRRNFRAAGKAVIINETGKILLIKRAGDETHLENLWDVPGGRFDYEETPQEGLQREVMEEAGIEVRVLDPVTSWTFMRDNGEQVFGTTFLCEPEGFEIELGEEHTDFQWVNEDDLDGLEMHDELREGLKKAHRELIKDD